MLLVEDDHAVRRTTERILERSGYMVTSTSRGASALDLIETAARPSC